LVVVVVVGERGIVVEGEPGVVVVGHLAILASDLMGHCCGWLP